MCAHIYIYLFSEKGQKWKSVHGSKLWHKAFTLPTLSEGPAIRWKASRQQLNKLGKVFWAIAYELLAAYTNSYFYNSYLSCRTLAILLSFCNEGTPMKSLAGQLTNPLGRSLDNSPKHESTPYTGTCYSHVVKEQQQTLGEMEYRNTQICSRELKTWSVLFLKAGFQKPVGMLCSIIHVGVFTHVIF